MSGALRGGAWLLGAAACVWLLRLALPYIWPFGLGLLVALGTEPAVAWLASRGVGRPAAAGLLLAGLLVGGAGAGVWLLRTLLAELTRHDVAGRLLGLGAQVDRLASALPEPVRAAVDRETGRLSATVLPSLGGLLVAMRHWAFDDVGNALLGLLVAFGVGYFVSRDRPALVRALVAVAPAPVASGLRRAARALAESLWGLARAEALLTALTFVLSWGGLVLMGAPYAFVAALLAAVLDLLPVVGPAMLYVPWAAMAWLGGRPGAALALLALCLAIALARWALTPRVVGNRMGLHPLTVIVSAYLGLLLLGGAGLILGPLAAVAVRGYLGTPAPKP